MRNRDFFAAMLAVALAMPVSAQVPPKAPETESCLLNRQNGRWVPSGMPEMHRVFGNDASSVIQYAGRIGSMSAFVTDVRCDNIAYEVILVGPGGESADLSAFLSVLETIEKEAGFSNAGELSLADRFSLEKDKKFEWEKDDERGEILLEFTDISTLVRARYVNTKY
jgi:hypothetical protein